jgi:hypothetical protein
MNNRVKWGAVTVLALTWAALLVTRLIDQPPPQRMPLTYRSGQAVPRESFRSGLEALTRGEGAEARAMSAPFKTPKNIFAPLESDGDEASKTKRARTFTAKTPPPSAATAPVSASPAVPAPSADELAARQAQQAIAQYRFLGYLTQAGTARAFLGKGQQIYIVTTGDLLDERIRVQAITASAVQLKDAGTNVEGTIPLSSTDGRGF